MFQKQNQKKLYVGESMLSMCSSEQKKRVITRELIFSIFFSAHSNSLFERALCAQRLMSLRNKIHNKNSKRFRDSHVCYVTAPVPAQRLAQIMLKYNVKCDDNVSLLFVS